MFYEKAVRVPERLGERDLARIAERGAEFGSRVGWAGLFWSVYRTCRGEAKRSAFWGQENQHVQGRAARGEQARSHDQRLDRGFQVVSVGRVFSWHIGRVERAEGDVCVFDALWR